MTSRKKVECTVDLGSSIDKIWSTITDNSNYAWRSDLSEITVSDGGNSFVEYTKRGIPTEFKITLKIPHERYEFDMKNDTISGHWTGIFTKSNARTKLTLMEEVEVNGFWKSLFAGIYLKRQQKRYVADLKRALGE